MANKYMTVSLFMKSGNVLVSDCVLSYTFVPSPTGVSKLQLEQNHERPGSRRILVASLCVDQIEGITVQE